MDKVCKPVVCIAAVVFSLPLIAFVSWYSVNVLLWDQWDYYGMFFQHLGFWGIFDWQHGHHRMGVGGIILWIVNQLTHWDMRAVSFVTALVILVSALLALRLKEKVFGQMTFTDIVIPACMLTMTQTETVLANGSLCQVAVPMMLLIVYALTLVKPVSIVKVLWLASLQFMILFSGYGETFFPVTVMLIFAGLWKNNKFLPYGASLMLLASSAISSVMYFVNLHVSYYQPYLRFDPLEMIRYMVHFGAMFSGIDGTTGDVVGLGYLSALGFVFVRSARSLEISGNVVLFLLSGCVLSYMAGSSVGRTVVASRYMTITGLGFATIFLAFRQSNLIAGFVLAAALHGSFVTIQEQSQSDVIKTSMRASQFQDCIENRGDAVSCNNLASVYPNPKQTHLVEKLEFMKQNRLGFFH